MNNGIYFQFLINGCQIIERRSACFASQSSLCSRKLKFAKMPNINNFTLWHTLATLHNDMMQLTHLMVFSYDQFGCMNIMCE